MHFIFVRKWYEKQIPRCWPARMDDAQFLPSILACLVQLLLQYLINWSCRKFLNQHFHFPKWTSADHKMQTSFTSNQRTQIKPGNVYEIERVNERNTRRQCPMQLDPHVFNLNNDQKKKRGGKAAIILFFTSVFRAFWTLFSSCPTDVKSMLPFMSRFAGAQSVVVALFFLLESKSPN